MSSIAAIQMVSGNTPEANLADAAARLHEAAAAGCTVAVLPENFAYVGPENRLAELAEDDGKGPIQDFLATQAQTLGIWIVGGTMPIADGDSGKVRGACPIYDDSGTRLARYDKLHLFDVDLSTLDGQHYRESDFLSPGEHLTVVDTPAGRLSIAICYDLRFPALFQAIAARQADIVAVPAAFTAATGAAHWDVLTRCRALDSQCYLVAANQGGRHPPDRETWGHSRIVDAWGQVVAEHASGAGLVYADIDHDALGKIRQRLPVRKHQRLDYC